MNTTTSPLECVVFMLIKDGRVLAEKRKLTKQVAPGLVALPGGHVDAGETVEATLVRELREELGIAPTRVAYVCTLVHRTEEFRKLHYFAIERWTGELENNEAEALLWIAFDELPQLNLDVDRLAMQEYLRVYHSEDK
jgi:mutator protein MutT